jgi:hypothetical protein
MKSWYIISIVASVIFIGTLVFFIGEAESLRWRMWNEWDYGDYAGDAYYEMRDLSVLGGGLSMLFAAFYTLLFSFTLKHIKRMTAKVISIIGLCFSGIALLVCMLPVGDPGAISFDEFALIPLLYSLIMLAFCIVNLVQASRNSLPLKSNDLIIDDLV